MVKLPQGNSSENGGDGIVVGQTQVTRTCRVNDIVANGEQAGGVSGGGAGEWVFDGDGGTFVQFQLIDGKIIGVGSGLAGEF